MTLAKETLKIGIVAGEHSGDILGSQLIEELSKSREIKLFGVGGPKIESLGLESMFDFKHLQIMGLIEPLLNYKNVLESIEKITSEEGLGMSPKRITVSTAGVAKMIEKLADDDVKFNLALSLHAANDEKRNKIMGINETNNLEVLANSLKYFYAKTKTRVTYEYIIFDKFNDELQDAHELYEFCKHIPCKVNIIEYNPIENGVHKQAETHKVDAFKDYLEERGLVVNIRRSRGKDIDAACGQLANKK